jgi:cytochrome c biogenesis protein
MGETLTLEDGTEITFTGVKEFAALQFSHDPGQVWVLGAAIALLTGLLGLLLLRRERFFARALPAPGSGPDAGGTVLAVASLTRGGGDPAPRFAALTAELQAALEARAGPAAARPVPPSGGTAPEPKGTEA